MDFNVNNNTNRICRFCGSPFELKNGSRNIIIFNTYVDSECFESNLDDEYYLCDTCIENIEQFILGSIEQKTLFDNIRDALQEVVNDNKTEEIINEIKEKLNASVIDFVPLGHSHISFNINLNKYFEERRAELKKIEEEKMRKK